MNCRPKIKAMPDRYNNFAELAAVEREGNDYCINYIDRSSEICIIAPHGGGIEPGTSEITTTLADGRFSVYLFEGIKRTGNKNSLHITSTRFDDPQCIKLINISQITVAIHGSEDEDDFIDIGGLNKNLIVDIKDSLIASGFKAYIDSSGEHCGREKRNICNRCLDGRGVQIEIPMRVRKMLFRDVNNREGRNKTTDNFKQLISGLLNPLLRQIV